MLFILLEILGYWLGTGLTMFVVMFTCLQFANFCEFIVDFFFIKK